MSIRVNNAGKSKEDLKAKFGKTEDQNIKTDKIQKSARPTINRLNSSKNPSKKNFAKESYQSVQLAGKEQKKLGQNTNKNKQDDKFRQNKNTNSKKVFQDNRLPANQNSELLSETDSQMTIQSNKRQKSPLISANRYNPTKKFSLFASCQQSNKSNDIKVKKEFSQNSLFYKKKASQRQINTQKQLIQDKSSNKINHCQPNQQNNEFLNGQRQQIPHYSYKKNTHQKGEDKMMRLKNKLGFIFDMASNDEIPSVSYYSESSSEKSSPPIKSRNNKQKKSNKLDLRNSHNMNLIKNPVELTKIQRKQGSKQAEKLPKQIRQKNHKEFPQKQHEESKRQKSSNQRNQKEQRQLITHKEKQPKLSLIPHNQNLHSERQEKTENENTTSSPRFQIKLQKVTTDTPLSHDFIKQKVISALRKKSDARINPFQKIKVNKHQNNTESRQQDYAQKRQKQTDHNFAQSQVEDYLEQQLTRIIKKNDEFLKNQKQRISSQFYRSSSNQKNIQQAQNNGRAHPQRRKIRTQMNHRDDEDRVLTSKQKGLLQLLKRKEDGLMKKIQYDASTNSRYLSRGSYDFVDHGQRQNLISQHLKVDTNQEIKAKNSTRYYAFSRMLPVLNTQASQSQYQSSQWKLPPTVTNRNQQQYFSNVSSEQHTNKLGDWYYNIRLRKREAGTFRYQKKMYSESDREYRTQNIRQKYQKIKRIVDNL